MVQTEDDAYDIAQETFLKFMKYGTSYKHHNLKGYLLTIARNICFNYFRDKKEKVTAIEWEEIDKIPNNKDMLTEAEDAVYLRNLLKELSQDTREVIILRIYEEMKFKDIAKIMGCSVSTTKSRFRLGVFVYIKLFESIVTVEGEDFLNSREEKECYKLVRESTKFIYDRLEEFSKYNCKTASDELNRHMRNMFKNMRSSLKEEVGSIKKDFL